MCIVRVSNQPRARLRTLQKLIQKEVAAAAAVTDSDGVPAEVLAGTASSDAQFNLGPNDVDGVHIGYFQQQQIDGHVDSQRYPSSPHRCDTEYGHDTYQEYQDQQQHQPHNIGSKGTIRDGTRYLVPMLEPMAVDNDDIDTGYELVSQAQELQDPGINHRHQHCFDFHLASETTDFSTTATRSTAFSADICYSVGTPDLNRDYQVACPPNTNNKHNQRLEYSKNAARERREKESAQIERLRLLVPVDTEEQKEGRVDLVSLFRMAAAMIRVHSVVRPALACGTQSQLGTVSGGEGASPPSPFPSSLLASSVGAVSGHNNGAYAGDAANFDDALFFDEQTLLDGALAGFVIVVDATNRTVLYVSRSVRAHTGFNQADMLGLPLATFMAQPDYDQLCQAIQQMLQQSRHHHQQPQKNGCFSARPSSILTAGDQTTMELALTPGVTFSTLSTENGAHSEGTDAAGADVDCSPISSPGSISPGAVMIPYSSPGHRFQQQHQRLEMMMDESLPSIVSSASLTASDSFPAASMNAPPLPQAPPTPHHQQHRSHLQHVEGSNIDRRGDQHHDNRQFLWPQIQQQKQQQLYSTRSSSPLSDSALPSIVGPSMSLTTMPSSQAASLLPASSSPAFGSRPAIGSMRTICAPAAGGSKSMVLRFKSLVTPRGRMVTMNHAFDKAVICTCRQIITSMVATATTRSTKAKTATTTFADSEDGYNNNNPNKNRRNGHLNVGGVNDGEPGLITAGTGRRLILLSVECPPGLDQHDQDTNTNASVLFAAGATGSGGATGSTPPTTTGALTATTHPSGAGGHHSGSRRRDRRSSSSSSSSVASVVLPYDRHHQRRCEQSHHHQQQLIGSAHIGNNNKQRDLLQAATEPEPPSPALHLGAGCPNVGGGGGGDRPLPTGVRCLPSFVTRHNLDMRVTCVSDSVDFLRYPRRHLVGRSFYEAIHPEDLGVFTLAVQDLLEKDHCQTGFYRLIGNHPDMVVWVQTEGVFTSRGQKAGAGHPKDKYVRCVHYVLGMENALTTTGNARFDTGKQHNWKHPEQQQHQQAPQPQMAILQATPAPTGGRPPVVGTFKPMVPPHVVPRAPAQKSPPPPAGTVPPRRAERALPGPEPPPQTQPQMPDLMVLSAQTASMTGGRPDLVNKTTSLRPLQISHQTQGSARPRPSIASTMAPAVADTPSVDGLLPDAAAGQLKTSSIHAADNGPHKSAAGTATPRTTPAPTVVRSASWGRILDEMMAAEGVQPGDADHFLDGMLSGLLATGPPPQPPSAAVHCPRSGGAYPAAPEPPGSLAAAATDFSGTERQQIIESLVNWLLLDQDSDVARSGMGGAPGFGGAPVPTAVCPTGSNNHNANTYSNSIDHIGDAASGYRDWTTATTGRSGCGTAFRTGQQTITTMGPGLGHCYYR